MPVCRTNGAWAPSIQREKLNRNWPPTIRPECAARTRAAPRAQFATALHYAADDEEQQTEEVTRTAAHHAQVPGSVEVLDVLIVDEK